MTIQDLKTLQLSEEYVLYHLLLCSQIKITVCVDTGKLLAVVCNLLLCFVYNIDKRDTDNQ